MAEVMDSVHTKPLPLPIPAAAPTLEVHCDLVTPGGEARSTLEPAVPATYVKTTPVDGNDTTSMIAPEQRVNKDLVIFTRENVGNGAFGAVFKGSFKGKTCAVKVLHHFVMQLQTNLPVGQGPKGAIESLERDSEFLKSFEHDNIVQHISTEKHCLWGNTILVTELMDCNLRTYFSGPGKESLTADGEVSLCKDVALGLAYIHSKQIIHRDLCGDNILLKLSQPVPVAKIADFGMSRMLDPTTLSNTLTAIAHRVGYLPPEAADEDQYDQSLDVFSLGAIMVQIVQRLETVQTSKDRSHHFAQIPATNKLKPVIERCLQTNPKRRPTSSSICDAFEGGLDVTLLSSCDSEADSEPPPKSKLAADGGGKITLSCSTEYKSYPLSQQTCWAIASFKAPFYEPTSRAPVDIVAVIDKSGSMAGEKLRLVKQALNFIIDQLKETDRLSVITYDTNVYVNFGLLRMNKAHKTQARSLVSSIYNGSTTNLCAGLLKGMDMLIGEEDGAQVQSVLLFTDGLANCGVTSTPSIVAEMKRLQERSFSVRNASLLQEVDPPLKPTAADPVPPSRRQSFREKVVRFFSPGSNDATAQPDIQPTAKPSERKLQSESTVYTFGFGYDHDATLLEAISTQGGGVYYYIDSMERIPESFAVCLGGLLSVVGQNLSLKLELQGGNNVSHVHANRAINWTNPNKSCDIGMGDIQSEEERDVVLELNLQRVSVPQKDLVLKVSLSYFNVLTSSFESLSCDLLVNRKDGEQGPVNEDVDMQKNRIVTVNAMTKAKPLAQEGKFSEAEDVIGGAQHYLEAVPTKDRKYTQLLRKDLDSWITTQEVKPHAISHYASNTLQRHSTQRENDMSDYYSNDLQFQLRSEVKAKQKTKSKTKSK